MFASSKQLLLASAILFAALPAAAAEESNTVAPSSSAKAIVKCPGIISVPMTADAEQSLPLRLLGNLACGSTVVILSDTEGYTAQIRTRDGREGYVALMYLATGTDSQPVPAAPAGPAAATPANGVVRWHAGAPGCDEFVSHGRHVESITANGITVQVSLQDTGWKYRANLAVSNQTGSTIDVQPGIITLDELEPLLRNLPATDTSKIAHTSTHQVLWTLADAVPSPSAVTNSSGTADRLAHRSYPTTDYLNPHITLASLRPAAFARTQSVNVEAIALKPVALDSQKNTAGIMWFARDERAHELSLRVPVGDMVFDFSFAFEDHK
jgi:hypothetical protein